jgi:hypothetical protein
MRRGFGGYDRLRTSPLIAQVAGTRVQDEAIDMKSENPETINLCESDRF